jgi:hypothetical protein
MKFGSLNILEPSGPHRACYGSSLPLHHIIAPQYTVQTKVCAVPQMQHLQPHIILQEDGAPPHWGFTSTGVPGRETAKEVDRQRRPEPLASSFTGHTTTGILHKGSCQENFFPTTVTETDNLRSRITDSTTTVHAGMFHRTWQELAYGLNTFRPTKGDQTEMS